MVNSKRDAARPVGKSCDFNRLETLSRDLVRKAERARGAAPDLPGGHGLDRSRPERSNAGSCFPLYQARALYALEKRRPKTVLLDYCGAAPPETTQPASHSQQGDRSPDQCPQSERQQHRRNERLSPAQLTDWLASGAGPRGWWWFVQNPEGSGGANPLQRGLSVHLLLQSLEKARSLLLHATFRGVPVSLPRFWKRSRPGKLGPFGVQFSS
jgi:hypothetical protein